MRRVEKERKETVEEHSHLTSREISSLILLLSGYTRCSKASTVSLPVSVRVTLEDLPTDSTSTKSFFRCIATSDLVVAVFCTEE
jgi:hypothetical protein